MVRVSRPTILHLRPNIHSHSTMFTNENVGDCYISYSSDQCFHMMDVQSKRDLIRQVYAVLEWLDQLGFLLDNAYYYLIWSQFESDLGK